MEYHHVVLVHVICAILFLGAIATEVLALGPLRSQLSAEEFRKIEFLLFRRIRRVYPPAVIALFATGFWMYAEYLSEYDSVSAFMATSFGFWLTLKMTLALVMAGVFLFSPFLFMPGNPGVGGRVRHFLMVTRPVETFRADRFDLIHYFVFALGFSVVVIAKLMFYI